MSIKMTAHINWDAIRTKKVLEPDENLHKTLKVFDTTLGTRLPEQISNRIRNRWMRKMKEENTDARQKKMKRRSRRKQSWRNEINPSKMLGRRQLIGIHGKWEKSESPRWGNPNWDTEMEGTGDRKKQASGNEKTDHDLNMGRLAKWATRIARRTENERREALLR